MAFSLQVSQCVFSVSSPASTRNSISAWELLVTGEPLMFFCGLSEQSSVNKCMEAIGDWGASDVPL